MAECPYCEEEMSSGVGCTAYPGRELFNDPRQVATGLGPGHCHDCGVPIGSMHHPGCDDERCDHGAQAIGDCSECRDFMHLPGCERSRYLGDGEWWDCAGCDPEGKDYWERVGGASASDQGDSPKGDAVTDDTAALKRILDSGR